MVRIFLFFLLLVLISGCGGGNSSAQSIPEIPTPTQLPGLLIQIETEDYLVDSVKRGFKDELAKGVVSVPAEYYSSRFTTSYSLEPNVDEHDYVKYDGEYLYIGKAKNLPDLPMPHCISSKMRSIFFLLQIFLTSLMLFIHVRFKKNSMFLKKHSGF